MHLVQEPPCLTRSHLIFLARQDCHAICALEDSRSVLALVSDIVPHAQVVLMALTFGNDCMLNRKQIERNHSFARKFWSVLAERGVLILGYGKRGPGGEFVLRFGLASHNHALACVSITLTRG